MSEYRIEVGDKVRVDFVDSSEEDGFCAEVLYMPCNTGEAWKFRTTDSMASIIYVQAYESITLLDKKSEPVPNVCDCGGKPKMKHISGGGFTVVCSDCRSYIRANFSTEKEAIEHWNNNNIEGAEEANV